MAQLHFLGANQQVTGSRYFLRAAGLGILIDCGLFQERDFQSRNWQPLPVPIEQVDVMLLTHAHLDHCGLLPRLVSQGFNKPVYTTAPSVELARLVMMDSAKIQEEDVQTKRKRHREQGREGPYPLQPLYTVEDAVKATRLFRRVEYNACLKLSDHVRVCYRDAGHILGSSSLEVTIDEAGRTRRLIFSGDIGQWNKPLLPDPQPFEQGDYVVMESTYGDREHDVSEDPPTALARVINEAADRGGKLLIPSFAIERAQELIFYMGQMRQRGLIPQRLPIFLDSPMGVEATKVFPHHLPFVDEETRNAFRAGNDPLRFPGVHYSTSRDDSKAINDLRGPAVILAGAGMCTGGRIKHHLAQHISKPDTIVLFVGYQAEHTLGREILDGKPEVRILGGYQPVRATIRKISGFSAHADRAGLLRWAGELKRPPKRMFLTHGEYQVSRALAGEIKAKWGWDVSVPAYTEKAELV
jgi:metallo-beta-lactamase family protein